MCNAIARLSYDIIRERQQKKYIWKQKVFKRIQTVFLGTLFSALYTFNIVFARINYVVSDLVHKLHRLPLNERFIKKR